MRPYIQDLKQFLLDSPTCFQAVEVMKKRLRYEDYEELKECEPWRLEAGGKYYVTRNGSSLIAFVLPEKETPRGFQITAAHTDSPTFKIKEREELSLEAKYAKLNVEKCGGSIYSTWVDRPLSVAGRVIVRDGESLRSIPVHIKKDLMLIPNLAIHLKRDINENCAYQLHVDMVPLWGSGDAKGSFRRLIADAAGVAPDAILGHDLYLYSREEPKVWGYSDEYLSAGHLDDLECVYTGLKALTEAGAPEGHVNVLAAFDNEEVGSLTKQGADSTFLSDVLYRIIRGMNMDPDCAGIPYRNSMMLSADNAHAVHPNHPELYDAVNRVYMNEGIVIKHNASQKYTTDGVSEALFQAICADADVPVQHFANRSDMPGGSTLGNLSNRHVSLNTVDIGLAQLAMHSSYETAGVADVDYMIRGMRAFYQAEIRASGDGCYLLGR